MFNKIKIIFILLLFYTISCKKLDLNKVSVITTDDVSIIDNHVIVQGTLIDLGNHNKMIDVGFEFFENETKKNKLSLGTFSSQKEFKGTLQNLNPDVEYKVYTYATDEDTTIFGDILTFKLLSKSVNIKLLDIKITSSSSIKITSNLFNLGSLGVKEFGICYTNENKTPSIEDFTSKINSVQKDTIVNFDIQNIKKSDKYTYRAYAIFNNNIVIYSNNYSETIPELIIQTVNFNQLNQETYDLIGDITQLAFDTMKIHGFCWSIATNNPSFNDSKINLGKVENTGLFTYRLTPTTSNTVYYFRAYASDGYNIYYGIVKSFSTF
jgi:hypothetical protein